MGVSCIVSEMKRYIGRNCGFSCPATTTCLEKTVVSILRCFFSQPSQIPALSGGGNAFCKTSSVYSQLTRVIDRQTNRRKSDLYSKASFYVMLSKSLLDPIGRECLCLASKSNFGLLWPWPLTSCQLFPCPLLVWDFPLANWHLVWPGFVVRNGKISGIVVRTISFMPSIQR